MSHILFNRLTRSLSLTMPQSFIAKGLLLVLLIILGNPTHAQTSVPPVVDQTQEGSEDNAVSNQLLGEWKTNTSESGGQLTLIFAPDNKLFFILPGDEEESSVAPSNEEESSMAIGVKYQIRTTTQPMELDISLSADETALTIFELTPEGKLRLELEGVLPGQPRPTQFSNNAPLFERISDAITVPETIELIELESQQEPTPSKIPIQYIDIVNRAQQVHFLETGKFAPNLEELGIVSASETEYYRYKIIAVGEASESVAVTAEPKENGLPSYIGAVLTSKDEVGNTTTVSVICESDQPSMTPPAMPTLVMKFETQCAAGSRFAE